MFNDNYRFEELEDRYDGLLPGDLPTDVEEAYYESLDIEEGALWEETV